MEESHIDWKGFSLIMSAYAARALSPGQDGSRKMRRMDMEVLATAQQLLGSAESERLSILQNIPQHDREPLPQEWFLSQALTVVGP
eukprot:1005091-Rhodomonas_salina.2